jgi:hypothetical protein
MLSDVNFAPTSYVHASAMLSLLTAKKEQSWGGLQ